MRASGCASARASAHAGKRADSHVLSEVCASVRAVQVRVLVRRESVRACARACRATTGPDPHDVERHHAARGRVGERKRVGGGWLVLFELPAMLVTCLEIWGPHDVYLFRNICCIMAGNML